MTSRQAIDEYTRHHTAKLTLMEGGEHWFHTPAQRTALPEWEEIES